MGDIDTDKAIGGNPAGRCTITEHEIAIRVRYAEVDRMGMVHHSRYAVWMEMGRTELLRANGYDYRRLEEAGIFMVVVRLECRFRHPARYDEELVLKTRLARADHVRLEHEYRLCRAGDGKLLMEGSTVLVHVDSDGRLQRLPEMLR